ncbi:putative hydrolase [Hyphodiscus hymeniophilus]|uniref:Hydrolase n=1 Tax=Hyphodiscus hymeniophilus TaxID=353542 RepID=A0A9P7B0R8_9HELO|nr:putative hydrolase [Hyphodiscus hymeniophilus]
MDGLLINTEDILTKSHNTILARYSAGPMSWTIKGQLQGRPLQEAIRLLLTWANLTDVVTPAEYTNQLHALQELEFPHAKALPGVEKLLRDLRRAKSGDGGDLHIALATSSDTHRFEIKTRHLEDLFMNFAQERRVLGDDVKIPKGRGKPWPEIYLLALKSINDGLEHGEEVIKPEECLVFEDAVPGVVAGRRAGMRVIWVPHPELSIEYHGREAEVLAGLGERCVDEPGRIGDGYGEQLTSLANFPYSRYGIVVSNENQKIR